MTLTSQMTDCNDPGLYNALSARKIKPLTRRFAQDWCFVNAKNLGCRVLSPFALRKLRIFRGAKGDNTKGDNTSPDH